MGSGTYGAVYQYDEYAIKIYHDFIKYNHYTSKNPCLDSPRRLRLLLNKSSKVHNTDLITDLLFINGEFKGVCYPYHDASTLASVIDDTTFSQKQSICRQLINNTRELNNNFIYPLDSKPDNILYNRGKIMIIDLDDVFTRTTHFFSPILLERSLYSLKKCIFYILSGDLYQFDCDLLELLEIYSENKHLLHNLCTSYGSLIRYVSKRSVETKLIFINPYSLSDLDIEKLKRIIAFTGAKVVLNFTTESSYFYDSNFYLNTIINLREAGIPIYDITIQKQDEDKNKKIIQCINNYNTIGYYIFDDECTFDDFKGHQSTDNDGVQYCINKLNTRITKK